MRMVIMVVGLTTGMDAIIGGYMQMKHADDKNILSGFYQVVVGMIIIYGTHLLVTSGVY